MHVQIIGLKIPSVDTHVHAPSARYVSSSLVGESCSEEQLLTHHDRNKSVAVSTVVNKANTIQYIIHFTWTRTRTHTRTHKIIKIATQTPQRLQLARAGTRGVQRADVSHMLWCRRITSACMNDQLETKEM